MAVDTDSSRSRAEVERLFRVHGNPLFRLAALLTGDRHLSEELVQETFLRVWQAKTALTPGSEFPYLRRTLINLVHSHHRHLRVVRRTPPDVHGFATSADQRTLQTEIEDAVVAAVLRLPKQQRWCVVLRYFEGISDDEIAAALGVNVGSVKTHLHRARTTLAVRLKEFR
jgi:RNA polymerase sigma-70 factor (sigma-E family)